ncbi:MAG: 8-oxo-dGTP diphosphatase [Gammaproteobacteria bacterium]|jgi:8-oxo-dGTP diphosphatase
MIVNSRETIVVGVIYNEYRDKVLLSRRPKNVHQGGLWEFPGGKLISGESQLSTLKRELFEEINISFNHGHHLISYDYDYIDKNIRLCVWIIYIWDGIPNANEGQVLEWVDIDALKSVEFPVANNRILKSLAKIPLF